MNMTPKSEVEKIAGRGGAQLQMASAAGETAVTTPLIELDFTVRNGDSVLRTATAQGASKLESRPAARGSGPRPPNRVLESDWIVAKMRDNGEEMESVETAAAGTLQFLPNHPAQPYRKLNGERIWITYGDRNQIKAFRAVNVTTETRKPRPAGAKADPPPAVTSSRDLAAEFDPDTGALIRLEQWSDFRYREGEQEATASHAVLDSRTNLITLSRPARAWDPAGWVTADQIILNQITGDFTAEGNVTSSRLPDRKAASTNAMLSQDEPVKATARRMVSTDRNRRIVYEGKALLSQSANNLSAEKVWIDRIANTLRARGQVVSQFLDRKADRRTGRPAVTIVHADELDYDGRERLAHYRGSARMIREGMDVKAAELRAWLNEAGKNSDSSLNRAFADGRVEIFQAEGGRTRLGTAPHAEYYAADEKVILSGGNAVLQDSLKGAARGKQLTYFTRNDNLLIEGAPTQPVISRVKRN
jgi:lipopolysaccharide export system protein LptA